MLMRGESGELIRRGESGELMRGELMRGYSGELRRRAGARRSRTEADLILGFPLDVHVDGDG